MKRGAAALGGLAFGFYATLLGRALPALVWPLAAVGLLRGAFVAGGVAALAVGVVVAARRGRACRFRGLAVLAAGVAGVAAAVAIGALAAPHDPVSSSGPVGLSALVAVALAAPFVAAGAALGSWWGPDGVARRRWFLCGAGAGILGASLLAVAAGPDSSPRVGGSLVEFVSGRIGADRGLREFSGPAEAGALAFAGAGGEEDVLLVGVGDGAVLGTLLALPQVRVTVLEQDAALAAAVLGRWPAAGRARAEGRLSLVAGAERWALARLDRAFDLVVVGESWSASAYRARALSHRRTYRWTVEAFAGYLARLAPDGRLLVRRNGIARALLTLRDAADLPPAEFARRVVVLGRRGAVATECWYSPAGFDSRGAARSLRLHWQRTGTRALYTPFDAPPGRNLYLPLARGPRVRGLAYSTPLDLSPPLDERPYFDHAERVMLGPRLEGIDGELEPRAGPQGLRLFLAADRALWWILVAGLLAAVAVRGLGGRAVAGAGAADSRFGGVLAGDVWRGAGAGLLVEGFSAWAGWLAPAPAVATAALAALVAGIGAGLEGTPPAGARAKRWVPVAALGLLLAAGGYGVLPAALAVGATPTALAMAGAGGLLGVAIGKGLGGGGGAAEAPAAAAAKCGAALAAASLAAVGGTLMAPHFGFRLLLVLGAVASIAPALASRSGVPVAAGAAT